MVENFHIQNEFDLLNKLKINLDCMKQPRIISTIREKAIGWSSSFDNVNTRENIILVVFMSESLKDILILKIVAITSKEKQAINGVYSLRSFFAITNWVSCGMKSDDDSKK